jgi:hypothetical protein
MKTGTYTLMAAIALSSSAFAGDIQFIPAPGAALVIKDSTGSSVRFQVNESGEIIIPSLPKTGAGQSLCRDNSTGEVIGCSGGGSSYVVRANGVVIGNALDYSTLITDQGYSARFDRFYGTIKSEEGLFYTTVDCTGTAFIRAQQEEAFPGYVFYLYQTESMYAAKIGGQVVDMTPSSYFSDFGGCGAGGWGGATRYVEVVPNDPGVTGVQYGTEGNPIPQPISVGF